MELKTKYNNQGILVFTIPRTGSAYLCNLFKRVTNPKKIIFEKNELNNLSPEGFHDCYKKDKNIYDILIKNNNYVAKVFYGKIEKYSIIPTAYKVLLIRKNIFENIMSFVYSMETNFWWASTLDNNEYKKIKISIELFKEITNDVIIKYNQLINNKHNIKYDMIVEYEDLVFDMKYDINNMKMSSDNIYEYNGIKSPSKSTHIINYNELKDYFFSNKYKLDNGIINNGIITDYEIQ